MKKTALFVFIFLAIALVSGCTGDKVEQEIKTDEGTVKITGTMGDDSDWCPEGGDWTMSASLAEGDMSATWKIDRLITSGKYAGFCHVIYTATGPEGDSRMDYYFDESGENGYIEMDIGGQKISQEWHS
ncbi:hypothetical protein KKA03_03320 [archaeon]|nr:hypothetical protein [archaeon]